MDDRCHESFERRLVLVCADYGKGFHFPDARIAGAGEACGVHVIDFRKLLDRDGVQLWRQRDTAFRLEHGIPS